MTTVKIDDALASRLRTLRGTDNDLDTVVADALSETAGRWQLEAQGRAEMQAMLDGPHYTEAKVHARLQHKYGFSDLSHLTDDELAD